jgi:hypothetical protein
MVPLTSPSIMSCHNRGIGRDRGIRQRYWHPTEAEASTHPRAFPNNRASAMLLMKVVVACLSAQVHVYGLVDLTSSIPAWAMHTGPVFELLQQTVNSSIAGRGDQEVPLASEVAYLPKTLPLASVGEQVRLGLLGSQAIGVIEQVRVLGDDRFSWTGVVPEHGKACTAYTDCTACTAYCLHFLLPALYVLYVLSVLSVLSVLPVLPCVLSALPTNPHIHTYTQTPHTPPSTPHTYIHTHAYTHIHTHTHTQTHTHRGRALLPIPRSRRHPLPNPPPRAYTSPADPLPSPRPVYRRVRSTRSTHLCLRRRTYKRPHTTHTAHTAQTPTCVR